MSKRFDKRTEEQFKEDIFFATAIENHFWDTWVSRCSDRDNITIENPADNGVANDGSFIAELDIDSNTLSAFSSELEEKFISFSKTFKHLK